MIQSSTVIIFLVHVIFAAKFQRLLTPIKKYSMTQLWGPLVAFKGFHPGLVRWCTMHVQHQRECFVTWHQVNET